MSDMAGLIKKVEALGHDGSSNELDVAIEIALFNPDVSIRSNSAGTKVIYTRRDGSEATHLAWDWTLSRNRPRTLALLRALQSGGRS